MTECQFDSIAELLRMGGHGPYVWFCFALALAVVLGNWLQLRRARRRFLRAAAARLARTKARKERSYEAESSEPLSGEL